MKDGIDAHTRPQTNLDQEQALADLDQAIGEREQGLADREQERIDGHDPDPEPGTVGTRAAQHLHRVAELDRDQLRQDAHQHQLDQAQDGREHRQAALDEQQEQFDSGVRTEPLTPQERATTAVERARAARARAEAALQRADAALKRARAAELRADTQD